MKTNRARLLITKAHPAIFFALIFAVLSVLIFAFAIIYYAIALHQAPPGEPMSFLQALEISLCRQTGVSISEQAFGIARLVAAAQQLSSAILLGSCASYLTIKMLVPSKDTVIFSPVAFFLRSENRYCVMLVNTSSAILENVEFMFVEKFFRRHSEPTVIHLPYLKNSVLSVKLGKSDVLDRDPKDFDPIEDGIKVSMRCSLPFTEYSCSRKYDFYHIYVVDSMDFRDRPDLQEPNLQAKAFWAQFENPLPNPESLGALIFSKRGQVAPQPAPQHAPTTTKS